VSEPDFANAADAETPARAHHRAVNTVIETKGLTKRFGERAAVDGVDLVVPAGAAFALLGPNGAGKTTLIRTLLGLTEPSSGEIQLLGLPQPARRREALARVGAIVEEPRFHLHLTGRENLKVAAAARTREADGRIDGALARVGLANRADERVKTYSLGMRQRLGIARALLSDPALLILDEPMNGLDPAGILEMRRLIRSFVEEGRTVFLSSHLLDEVEKTTDAVAIVDRGRVVVQGSIDEIVAGGEPTVVLDVDDSAVARSILSRDRRVRRVTDDGSELRVVVSDGLGPSDLNRLLVSEGVAVSRLAPASTSLEERFLDITSRLEATA
jgi:ABC-2 type transport system ATP-binding protein